MTGIEFPPQAELTPNILRWRKLWHKKDYSMRLTTDGIPLRARKNNMNQAYCFKCKSKKELFAPEEFKMKNGSRAMRGVCSTCGAKLFLILKNERNNGGTSKRNDS